MMVVIYELVYSVLFIYVKKVLMMVSSYMKKEHSLLLGNTISEDLEKRSHHIHHFVSLLLLLTSLYLQLGEVIDNTFLNQISC